MRITNGMMINNTLSNINLNKLNVDKFATQQATEKKIQKPSEDPIVAVRALRFRSQLAELNQYLEKNIPDARSWLELTEDALEAVSKNLSDMQGYLNQASNDTNSLENRQALIKTLTQFREQVYEDANSDYGGRRIFTGYKTNMDMTFSSADKNVKYTITENFTANDFDTITKVFNPVDVSGEPKEIKKADMPTDKSDIYRIRLAYDDISKKKTTGIDADGNPVEGVMTLQTIGEDGTATDIDTTKYTVKTVSADGNGGYVDESNNKIENPYEPGENEIYILTDTGEMIFGKGAYTGLKDEKLSLTYTKQGFEKNDLRPEHYFDCTRYTTENGKAYAEDVKFESNQQDIRYTVNFNQKLKVNSEGKNLFSHDVIRDLEDMIIAVENLSAIEEKISKIKQMQESNAYPDKEKELESMYEAAVTERDLQDDIVQKLFEKGITLYAKHQNTVDNEIADVGSRYKRLELNESRLESQQTSLEDLKSKNEDVNLPETIIKLSAASMVYDASLSAASKIVTKSLLDYL